MILLSWNVNGIRAIAKKGFHDIIADLNPDILCLQETKAQVEQVREVVFDMDYHIYANHAEKKGYSGTAILSRVEPLNVTYDLGIEDHDKEGRIITAEYEEYYVVTGYIPNSKSDLSRLEDRKQWDKDLYNYLKKLEEKKPVPRGTRPSLRWWPPSNRTGSSARGSCASSVPLSWRSSGAGSSIPTRRCCRRSREPMRCATRWRTASR